MNKPILINCAWVMIACATFFLGKTQSEKNQGDGGQGRDGRIVQPPTKEEAKRARKGIESNSENERQNMPKTGRPGMSADEMVMTMKKVLQETDPLKRQRDFSDLLESLTAENAEAAMEIFRKTPKGRLEYWQESSLLMFVWGKLDGENALKYTGGLDGREKEWSARRALAGWANQDPEAAKFWVSQVEDKRDWNKYTQGLISGLAQRDAAEATDYVLSLPAEKQDRDFMLEIARHQMSQGIEVVKGWADGLPDNKMKGDVLGQMAGEFVKNDPAAAASWAEKYTKAAYGADVVSRVAEEWAEEDPPKALEWVTTLADGAARNKAMKDSLHEWARRDLDAAGEFVAGLEAGGMRDSAASTYAKNVVRVNPETAMEWAQSIDAKETRSATVVETARDWIKRDEDAARIWIEGAGLSEEMVKRIEAKDPAERIF